jgi:hypothetical protein
MNRYQALGIIFVLAGGALALFSYFIIVSTPLTALGIGVSIIGLSILITPINPIPTQSIRSLVENSVVNIERLLEELGVTSRAYYVPIEDGEVYVYIPLAGNESPPEKPVKPKGMTVEVNGKAFMVLVPPSANLIRVEGGGSLEAVLSEVLVDLTEFCDSVKVGEGEVITIELNRPRASVGVGRFKRVMGSVEASIAASVAAATLGRPVHIESEVDEKSKRFITLRVL